MIQAYFYIKSGLVVKWGREKSFLFYISAASCAFEVLVGFALMSNYLDLL